MPVRAALGSAMDRVLRLGIPGHVKNPAEVRSIVVIKSCCLGDLLLATPSLAALRKAFPRAHISLAVSTWARPAIENNPHIDSIVECEGYPGRHRRDWKAYYRLIQTIRAGCHDLAIVLDRSLFASLAAWGAGVPIRVGIDSGGRGFSLTKRVPWTQVHHEADLYLDVVRAANVPVGTERKLFYQPATMHRMFAERIFQEWQLRDTGPVVVIHPGGGSNPGTTLDSKRWPATRYAALADRLIGSTGAQIIMVGHGSDIRFARQMRIAMSHEVPDLVGQTSFGQLAALIQQSDLYVGNDSGATHLAGAVGTPLVALFGPTSPAVYGPRIGTGISLFHADACPIRDKRPLGAVRACHDCQCIKALTIDEVHEAALSLLQTGLKKRPTPTEHI